MNSIFWHMELVHNIKLKNMWRCSICSCELDGMHMRHHYKRCIKAIYDWSGSQDYANQRGAIEVAQVLQDEGDSQSHQARSAPESSIDSNGPIRPASLANPLPANDSVKTGSTEVTGLIEINETDIHLEANKGINQNEGSTESDSLSRASAFFNLLAIAFKGCKSKADLNEVLKRCVEDWLAKSSRALDSTLEGPRPRPQLAAPSDSARNRRNQSQQLQRLKKNEKARSHESSRVQRLFNIYPKRAVMKVLGERPLQYTGSMEHATYRISLRRTYEAP